MYLSFICSIEKALKAHYIPGIAQTHEVVWLPLASTQPSQDGGFKIDFLQKQSSPGWKREDSSDQNGVFMTWPLQPLGMASTAPILGEVATRPPGLQHAHADLTS